jgi:hypothetical protein
MEKESKQYKVLFIPVGVIAEPLSGNKDREDVADFHIDLEFLERVKDRGVYRVEIIIDDNEKYEPMYAAVQVFVFNYLKEAVHADTVERMQADIKLFPKVCGGRWDWACVGDSDAAQKIGVSFLEKESV